MGYEVDFLAVGDGSRGGDAIALRFGNLHGTRAEQKVVLIDGGWSANGEKLVELVQDIYCTDQVELVILTHPDDDHSNGLFPVLEGLNVGQLAMHLPWNHTEDIARMFGNGRVTDASVKEKLRRSLDSACELSQLAKQKGIQVVEPFAGDHAFGGAQDGEAC